MKVFMKKAQVALWILGLLAWVPAAHGADSLVTIGAAASITTTSGADVCADSLDIDADGLFDGNWCGGSLLAELTSFTAVEFADGISLVWKTASEVDCVGFHLWRRSGEADYVRITPSLIPSEGSLTEGATYEFVDDHCRAAYCFYMLEGIDIGGVSNWHGPIEVEKQPGFCGTMGNAGGFGLFWLSLPPAAMVFWLTRRQRKHKAA